KAPTCTATPPRPSPRREGRGWSSPAFGFEHGGGQSLAAVLAGPDDELEGLVVALARLEGGLEQSLALVGGGERPVEHQALAEHDQPFLRPHIEVAEPELLVDLGY